MRNAQELKALQEGCIIGSVKSANSVCKDAVVSIFYFSGEIESFCTKIKVG